MSRVVLAFPGGNTIPKCRLCGERADLVIRPSGHGIGQEYAYCAKCVDTAMERAEVGRGDR